MSEWKEYRFSKFVEISPSVTLKPGAICSFVEMADLKDGNKFCEPSTVRPFNSSGTKFQERDTLFARITPCLENGKICQVRNLLDNRGFGSTEFHVFRGSEGLSDTDFVYYVSRWSGVRDFAEANFHGTSGRQRVPRESFDNLFLKLPGYTEQRAIAGVLSSLDDKIDLLHRQNKTLAGMAEALWRQMFVEEADPGWRKGKLGDIAEINPLRSIKKGAIVAYLDMSNMPTNGPFPKEWVQREFSSGMKFKNGDTVMARITPCLENGKTAYVNFLTHDEIAWGSTEYIVLAPKPGYCSEWYYFLARNDDFRDFAIQNMTGTSGRQRVSGDSIAQYEIVIPPVNIFEGFGTFAGPVMEHIRQNSFQIRTLSRLRDTLLPKLMSGEVKVKL